MMELIIVFAISILILFLSMILLTFLIQISYLIDFWYSSYIFRKYDIEEIKTEKDMRIFVKKLLRFYMESTSYPSLYRLIFRAKAGKEIEIQKGTQDFRYYVDEFNNGNYNATVICIKSTLWRYLTQYKDEINEVIKSKRKKLLSKFKS